MAKLPKRGEVLTAEQADHLDRELEAARRRLGTPKETLRWFLDFLEIDLARQSPAELTIISYNLLAAGNKLDSTGWGKDNPMPPMTVRTLRKIQQEIAGAFTGLFSDRARWTISGPRHIGYARVSPIDAKHTELDSFYWTPDRVQFILLGFAECLWGAKQYLRSCKRCRKPFTATMRQEYCSTNCSQITRNEKKKANREAKKK